MTTLSYLIWNGSPEIFSIGSFVLRWYGLLFALGFLISQQILYYIHKQEGKPEKDVDTLTIYMVVATIIGARLGHVIFYEPEIIWTEPLNIFLPFQLNPFKFTGLQGLASHGGAIGILFALWLYSRKKKPGQNYFQVLDRIVILVALTGALIRLGNYFNSEIIGVPTDKPWGVVFANRLSESIDSPLVDPNKIIDSYEFIHNDTAQVAVPAVGHKPVLLYIFFKPDVGRARVEELVLNGVGKQLIRWYDYFYERQQLIDYQISQEESGAYVARISTIGIARHPAQLYESISCVILFIILFLIWKKHKLNLPQGRLFGIFLIVCFGLRFMFEFLKEVQEPFELGMPLNMGQILSIPLVLAGFVVLYMSFRNPNTGTDATRRVN